MERIIRLFKRPVSDFLPYREAVQKWRFSDPRLAKLFEYHGIHLEHSFKVATPHQTLLASLEIRTYGEAATLAAALKKLYISKLVVTPEVNISKRVIDKQTLMFALEKYIDQEHRLERMLIKASGLRAYYIENLDLVIAQRIFTNQELKEDVRQVRQEALQETAWKKGIPLGDIDWQSLRRLLGL